MNILKRYLSDFALHLDARVHNCVCVQKLSLQSEHRNWEAQYMTSRSVTQNMSSNKSPNPSVPQYPSLPKGIRTHT